MPEATHPSPAPLILASGSPRRRELLAALLRDFSIFSSPVEETGDTRAPATEFPPLELPPPFTLPAEQDPRLWAWRKGMDVLERHTEDMPEGSLLLAADTIVLAPGQVLGKPYNSGAATAMLDILRGRDHLVITGFVLLRRDHADVDTLAIGAVLSTVTMRDYSADEVAAYVATGEPFDKAGAYAVQGLGGSLVERVDGCWTNVVGLPLCEVRRALEGRGQELLPYPEGGYCNYCPRNVQQASRS